MCHSLSLLLAVDHEAEKHEGACQHGEDAQGQQEKRGQHYEERYPKRQDEACLGPSGKSGEY